MRQCFPELLLVSCAELIKESLFTMWSVVIVLFLTVWYCPMSLGSPVLFAHLYRQLHFCIYAQSRFIDNHGRFCLFGRVPFGMLSSINCINCCFQFSKDTLMSLLLISLSQSVLSIKVSMCLPPYWSGLGSHLLLVRFPFELQENPVVVRVPNR